MTGIQNANNVSTDLSGVDYYIPNMPSSHPHLDLGPDAASPHQDGLRL